MNKGQIRANIRANLYDSGLGTYYTDDEINTSLQDAYGIIVAQSYCIIKSVVLPWRSEANYYDFVSLGVSDYLGTIAIFNTETNQWLRDDLSLRDYDRIRRDWELWHGAPMFWTPHSIKYIAIAPKEVGAVGTFTLWYWAIAPQWGGDNSTPMIAADMQSLFEFFCTADMLETAKEMVKSQTMWEKYLNNIKSYRERCLRLAKSDVLLRI